MSALTQLQDQGVDVSTQLKNAGREDLIRFTPLPAPAAGPPRVGHKYGTSPAADRTIDGIVFDSKLEGMAYTFLQSKHIKFDLQPRYVLQEKFTDGDGKKHRSIVYVGDFLIHGKDGDFLVDMKGVVTPMFNLKEKLLMSRHGLKIHCLRKINDLFRFCIDNKIL